MWSTLGAAGHPRKGLLNDDSDLPPGPWAGEGAGRGLEGGGLQGKGGVSSCKGLQEALHSQHAAPQGPAGGRSSPCPVVGVGEPKLGYPGVSVLAWRSQCNKESSQQLQYCRTFCAGEGGESQEQGRGWENPTPQWSCPGGVLIGSPWDALPLSRVKERPWGVWKQQAPRSPSHLMNERSWGARTRGQQRGLTV